MTSTAAILDSWNANAENWIQTIDQEEIASRKWVTNQAITEAVCSVKPATVLDLGCGEGWLTRKLGAQGMDVLGVDGIPALLENAQQKGRGQFQLATYQDITQNGILSDHLFDAIVINFALIDKEDTEHLIQYLPNLLQSGGHIIIQTLHPFSSTEKEPYQSGWREGSWNGMQRAFVQPYQWYFRTLGDWIALFRKADLELVELREPLHPQTLQPASVIFMLKKQI